MVGAAAHAEKSEHPQERRLPRHQWICKCNWLLLGIYPNFSKKNQVTKRQVSQRKSDRELKN